MRGNRWFATTTLMAALLYGLVAAPRTSAVARADLSLDVVPNQARAGDTVELSGGCNPGWSSSETGLRLSSPDLGVDVDLEPIPLEQDGTFSGVPRTVPASVPPGTYTLYTDCDAEARLTVLPAPTVLPSLTLDPPEGRAGDGATATGTCSPSSGSTDVVLGGQTVSRPTVDSTTGAFNAGFTVPDLDPRIYEVTTTCGGRATFEVVAPPPEIPATLELDPVSGAVDDSVTATGTCPVSSGKVTVYFGDHPVGSEAVDSETGVFAPVEFAVPAADVGPVIVETDCGADATFTVTAPTAGPVPPGQPGPSTPAPPPPGPSTPAPPTPGPPTPGPPTPAPPTPGPPTPGPPTPAPPTPGPPTPGIPTPGIPTPGTPPGPSADPAPTTAIPTETPDGVRILVPDLSGMTEAEVIAALGDQLVLGNPTGEDGRVQRQAPPPGTLVEPASAVTVMLDDPPEPASLSLPIIAVLVGAMIGALLYSDRLRRRHHRERRWVDSQVRTDVRLHEADVSAFPDQSAPGLDLRLEARRDPARLQFQEVGDVPRN